MNPANPSKKLTVLIADDMADTRDSLTRLLHLEKDIEVIGGVSDGQQAIEMARKVTPDIVLLDVSMPVVDGISAAAAIRESGCGSAVIMMSIRDDVQYFRQAMLAGARDFLTKPFTGQDLIQAIRGVYEQTERTSTTRSATPTSTAPATRIVQWAEHRRGQRDGMRQLDDAQN
jgi:pilus assembly protein CpaE